MPYASTEARRAAFRRWYAKNRATVCAKKRAFYWRNRKQIKRARAAKYMALAMRRVAATEAKRAYVARYYQQHRDELCARERERYARNRGAILHAKAIKYAAKYAARQLARAA